jgi:hypothetical protein
MVAPAFLLSALRKFDAKLTFYHFKAKKNSFFYLAI